MGVVRASRADVIELTADGRSMIQLNWLIQSDTVGVNEFRLLLNNSVLFLSGANECCFETLIRPIHGIFLPDCAKQRKAMCLSVNVM